MPNSNPITIKAPAKINIGLRVLDRRDDGYHNIITIFQRVNLHDTLILSQKGSGVQYSGEKLTSDSAQNLCVIAAKVFIDYLKMDIGLHIQLDKKIPIGAGLGGGSSDAAATILGMNELFNTRIDNAELTRIASYVGSDVPFFMLRTTASFASGRGELLSSINGLDSSSWVLIIVPDFEVSTAWAYSCVGNHLTLEKNHNILFNREFLEYQGDIPTANMGNDFEYPVFDAHPELRRERDRLLGAGATFAMLSGSGSSLFGVFDGEAEARAAALESPFGLSFVCRPY